MSNKNNTYSTLTQKQWYETTGEYVEKNTTLEYTNNYGGTWYITIN